MMDVLFIGREKANGRLSPVLMSQADSLKEKGINIHFFAVETGGVSGYIKSWLKLRKLRGTHRYDLFHAHYYLCGIVATLSGSSPLVVSLMGSELKSGPAVRLVVRFFVRHVWKQTVVKSSAMLNDLDCGRKARIIPNGVDMEVFRPLDRSECQSVVGYSSSFKHILFISDPCRKEKNYKLAEEAVALLSEPGVQLHIISGIDHHKIPEYMGASDLLLLTSLHEGSPNVVKEAMACNLPVVSTPVGDVADVIEGVEGCFIARFDAADVADKVKRSLERNKRTEGRHKIERLDSKAIASVLLKLYEEVTV